MLGMEGSKRESAMEISDVELSWGGREARRGQVYVSGEAEDAMQITSLCRNLQLESACHL